MQKNGHFDYTQNKISIIANEIKGIIDDNHIKNAWGDFIHNFSPETIGELENAVKALKTAYTYVDCVDTLISGGCTEQTFREILNHELNQ